MKYTKEIGERRALFVKKIERNINVFIISKKQFVLNAMEVKFVFIINIKLDVLNVVEVLFVFTTNENQDVLNVVEVLFVFIIRINHTVKIVKVVKYVFIKKQKSRCIECGGGSICIHHKCKSSCKKCSPQLILIRLVRCQVFRIFKNSRIRKFNHSIEYLGCDTDRLKEHFKKKMTDEMTFDNIHIDHIKPVSKFNLHDEEELLKCCHFTNLQPLLSKDNLELNNKWSEENEIYWNEYIIYNPDFDKIYKL
jgi:ribosomal protein S27AE